MASIYKAPITAPELDFRNSKAFNEQWAKYEEELKAWCIKRKNAEHVGEIITFTVADGSALYMVASVNPPELIHLDYLDGYQFEYDYLLSVKEIKEKIARKKSISKIFGGSK